MCIRDRYRPTYALNTTDGRRREMATGGLCTILLHSTSDCTPNDCTCWYNKMNSNTNSNFTNEVRILEKKANLMSLVKIIYFCGWQTWTKYSNYKTICPWCDGVVMTYSIRSQCHGRASTSPGHVDTSLFLNNDHYCVLQECWWQWYYYYLY